MTARDINPRAFAEKFEKGALLPLGSLSWLDVNTDLLVAILPPNMQPWSENSGKQDQDRKVLDDIILYLATAVFEAFPSYP